MLRILRMPACDAICDSSADTLTQSVVVRIPLAMLGFHGQGFNGYL